MLPVGGWAARRIATSCSHGALTLCTGCSARDGAGGAVSRRYMETLSGLKGSIKDSGAFFSMFSAFCGGNEPKCMRAQTASHVGPPVAEWDPMSPLIPPVLSRPNGAAPTPSTRADSARSRPDGRANLGRILIIIDSIASRGAPKNQRSARDAAPTRKWRASSEHSKYRAEFPKRPSPRHTRSGTSDPRHGGTTSLARLGPFPLRSPCVGSPHSAPTVSLPTRFRSCARTLCDLCAHTPLALPHMSGS